MRSVCADVHTLTTCAFAHTRGERRWSALTQNNTHSIRFTCWHGVFHLRCPVLTPPLHRSDRGPEYLVDSSLWRGLFHPKRPTSHPSICNLTRANLSTLTIFLRLRSWGVPANSKHPVSQLSFSQCKARILIAAHRIIPGCSVCRASSHNAIPNSNETMPRFK